MSALFSPARLYGMILIGLCVGFTLLSLTITVFGRARESWSEKRELEVFPKLPGSLAQWETFPGRFETAFNDHFGLRKLLLRLNSYLAMTQRFPARDVIQGKDGWLFYAGESALELYRNERQLSRIELEIWREELSRRKAWLAARKVGYLFVVVPDKHTIYPEFMPAIPPRRDRQSQYDQLVSMAQGNDIPILDLRPALRAAKAGGRLYLKHDTHWNNWGAYLGYREMMDALTGLPDRHTLRLDSGQLVHVTARGDLATMAGFSWMEPAPVLDPAAYRCRYEIRQEPGPRIGLETSRTHCRGEKYKVVILHDSFGVALHKYFGQSFGEAVNMWPRPTFAETQEHIERERPDFVIEQRAERFLQYGPHKFGPPGLYLVRAAE